MRTTAKASTPNAGRRAECAACLLLSLAAGPLALAANLALESPSLRVAWNPTTALISSMVDKTTGREWLDTTSGTPVYRIKLADQKSWIGSYSAASVAYRQEGETLELVATHDKPVPLTVTCRFRMDQASGQLLGRIALRAPQPLQIEEVRFPVLKLTTPFSGTGTDDRVLSPYCDGTLLSDPGKNSGHHEYRYPGSASLQMMAAFDPTAGLYLASHDNRGHTKTFCSGGNGKLLELGIGHLPPQLAVKEWEMPYEIALRDLRPAEGVDHITWEAAADIYRQWAVQQSWCRQTAAQRVAAGDIPKWLVEPNLVFTFSLRGKLPTGGMGNRLPMLVEQTQAWSELVEAPVTALIMSWEKHDSWVTPDYFPPYGGEQEFRAATQALHAQGHRTMLYLSGLHWTLHKDMAGPGRPHVLIDQQAEFDRRGRPFAISDANGKALIGGKPTAGVGQNATICASTPLAREILLGSSLRCQELGTDCVQVDQICGGGMKACYHPDHAHPPGGGSWCAEALYGLFGEIRREGKARDQDFAFSIEEPGELYLPILDTYHARDLHQGRWPRQGAGILGVPLFTHVYHDYLPGYGSEGCYVSERASQLAMYQLGMNLVCGKVPSVAIWGGWVNPRKLHPTQARLLKEHFALWSGAAGEFLSFGQRVASPALDVPTFDKTFVEKDGKTRRQLALPCVLHSAWKLADGRTGTIFACIHDKPVTFAYRNETLTLAPGEAAFRPGP